MGHLDTLVPVELQGQILVVAPEPVELVAKGRARVETGRRQQAGQRLAQVHEARPASRRRLAPPGLLREAVLRAEHQRDPEQALQHAVVDLAGEIDAGLEQARAAC